ncbi:centrosome-associated protein ALMS1 isoform X7 [Diceros bicornis minor]|uniref:centrosome-associated protein ALMS1 isoform X7 n=1 Tax=Diceros bicornis minor TaxID=77932 RepID=UPI0026ED8CDA|nr:centrosome-associated protein ALMS1 isoform X7 [Diceros bicornis minor]
MEPEDLPWPSELEEEVEEEAEQAETLDQDEADVVEEMEEEEGRELDADLNYERQPRESTDDEDDEEAKAWLQARPRRTLPPPSLPRHCYLEGERTGSEEGTESWHCLPQEMDSSHILDTTQTRFNVKEEGTEVTDFSSLEEGILTQSESQVKEPNRDLCSPLLVIQDSFGSPDLPLLTCLTQDQEFTPDSLFHQSELDFAPLRGIPGKSEDTEWFSRPSEVSEALFQAASEVASDLVSSCFSVSQHPLVGSTVESQRSFLPPEQGPEEETISSDTVDELKTPKDSDGYDALCSNMSWKTQEVIQEPETNLADKDQVSFSTSSDTSDEYITPKGSDSFEASCSYVQYGKQEAVLQQSEKYLASEDHDSYSDSSDTTDKNKIPKESDSFGAPFSGMLWSEQGASHHPETCLIIKDCVSFPQEVAPHFNNKMSYSFFRCSLERRRKGVPLMSDSHYFESVCLRAPAENEVKQKMDSLVGCERNEKGLGKELSQCFELKEDRNTLVFSEGHPRSSEIQCNENVVVPENSVTVSETHILSRGHDTSKMEASGGPLQITKSNLDETSEQLYFQEERNQKAASAFGGKNVDATENVAFEAVIASIEPSKKESTANEIQTDINKSSTNDSQESEPKNPHLSLLSYNDEESFFDKLSHPRYQSTPGVFEPAASKPLLYKKDDDDSSLYQHANLKSLPSVPQEMIIKPLSLIPELKSSASLNEKSHSQAVGLCKTQSALFQCNIDNKPFLPLGKIKSVSALDLEEKVGSSNIIYPVKISTSDSLVLQDLKQQIFEEVADSSNYILEGLQGKAESDICTLDDDTECCSLDENALVCSKRDAELQREIYDQGDLTGECIELAGLENLLDDLEICDSSLHWQSTLQLPSKEESNFEEPVGHSNVAINQSFSSVLLPFVPHEPTRESEYRSSDLRMLRVSPDTVPKTVKHLAGDTSKGGIAEITQSSLTPGIAATPGDSDIGSHLSLSPEDFPQLAVRSFQENTVGQHIDSLNRQALADSHLTEETLKVLTVPELADQKTAISTVPSSSYSERGKSNIFYPQGLPNSHLTEEALKVSVVAGPADQKTGIPTVPPSSYSLGEKPSIFYQQALSDSHLTEEALKVSAVPGSADQKTKKTTVEKHVIFSQQQLPDSSLTEEALKVSVVPGPVDQKSRILIVPSSFYSLGEKPGIFYQQALPDSHLTEEALKVSASPEPDDQKTGIPAVTSTSYSHREKPSIFYQQELPDSHLTEQAQKVSAVSGFAEQKKTGAPIVTSTSYLRGEKPHIFYQQTLPDSHLTEQAQKVSTVPGFAEQKTGIRTVTSASYSHREKPSIYQQELPDSHLTEQAQKVSTVPEFAEQKTGAPAVTSTSYSPGEKPRIFYQQTLPDSHLTERAQKVSAVSGFAEQKTEAPIVTSTSYSPGEKPHIFYQQELPDSHLTEQGQKVSAVPGFGEQKTGTPTVTSTSYSHREKPSIYQQELPGSHLTEPAQNVPAVPGSAHQKTGIPIAPPTSYSCRGKTSIFYQQELPDSCLTEQAQKIAAIPGQIDQNTGIQTVPFSSYSHTEKPIIFYQQELPDSHLTKEALKVSAVPGPADPNTGLPTGSSRSYSFGEKPSIFSQQALPDSHLSEEALKVSSASKPGDQKTGVVTVPSSSYSPREKPSIFYQQALPGSNVPEEVLKVSVVAPGAAEKKSGSPSEASSFYSEREKSSVFYQQELPDSHLTEEAQKVSAVSGPADQKTRIPTVTSTSYSHRENPFIFYPQGLPDSHPPEEALKISAVAGPADQKTGLPSEPSSSYSHREKPIIFYPQGLTDSRIAEKALKVSAVPGPADQKTGLPSEPSSSYSHREKPIIFYPQGLTDSCIAEEALKVSAVSGPADQKTGLPSEPSSSYSHREKPIIFYPQGLTDSCIAEEALKVSAVPGPADQKTGLPSEPSSSYSHREKSSIFYQQDLPDSHLTEEALKVSAVPGPGDQKTRKPAVTSISYSHREKPSISYQQELPGSHLTEEALKVSGVPGPADQKTGIPTVLSSSYSYGEKPIIFYQQRLPDLTQEALKVLGVPGPVEEKTGISAVTSTSSSHGEKLVISYQQELPDITEETLKVSAVSGPADQKAGTRIIPSSSYSHSDKANIFDQQELPHLTEEALKVFALPGPAAQKTEIPTGPSSSYSHKEKLTISSVILPDDQKTELPTASPSSYSHIEKPKNSTVTGSDDQKTPLLTVFRNFYSQRVKPSIFFKQKLPDRHQSGDILKISTVPEQTDVNSGIPIPLSSSYSHRKTTNIFYPQELLDKHLTEDTLKVSTIPGPADQKTVSSTAPPSSFSHREKPDIFSHQDLPDTHLTEDALKFSSGLGQADLITGLSTVSPGTYSHSEKHKLVSDHVQRLIDNLDSSNSSIISNSMPLNSQADGRVVISKPESSGFEDVGSEEIRDTDNGSKSLKEIRTLLMEAENIALKRCNFPAPLLPFRDVSDISFIQSKKVVCFKEPPTTDESNDDLPQRQPFAEEIPSNKCIQKDISTQTNVKCQRSIENREFISSATVRSPLQEAESKAKVALDKTLRQYKTAKSVMRSESEGCSGTIGNKIVIPMMTIIRSDSSSDASSCSWDSNSMESVSDVLLNFFPYASSKTSMTDSREEEGVSESDDGGSSSVDSLAAHVKNLLKCESSLNHAKQILRNAEEEECRVRARAWNLKFNLAHECGYSISELNEDDRRKVEEIKAKLFGHGRTADLSTIVAELTSVPIFLYFVCGMPPQHGLMNDVPSEEIKTPFSAFSGKLSSDAVTQITTESPEKAVFSSEIFISAEDQGHEIPDPSAQKLGKVPVKFASSSSVQQITVSHGTDAQPSLLPYKPSGSMKMYYVPQLRQIPSSLDSKSDTTVESSHSGSNDAVAPDFPAQVLGTRDDDLTSVNIKHKEGIYSKRAVTKTSLSVGKKPFQKDNADAQVQVPITGDDNLSDKNQKKEIYSKRAVTEAARPEEKESLQKDTAGSSDAAAAEHSAQLQDTKVESLPGTKAIKQKEEIPSKREVPKEAWSEDKESLQINIAESRRHSEFENTTHSVFKSAKFYFHHPVHLPSDQEFCHDSLGRSVFMKHSWKDFFQHHADKQREYTCLPPPYQNVEKTKMDYTKIESLSINVNLENKEVMPTTKNQARDYPNCDKQINDPKRGHKVTPELTTQHTVSLNELWNKYQERQRQQKPPEFTGRKELSLVERLDRLAKLLQSPITHSLWPSESTQDDSRGERDVKEWSGRQQQQKNKLQQKKRCKSLEKCNKNTGDLKKTKVLSTHQGRRSNQIKIEQIKFDKYILRKQPSFHYINNTSDSRVSEESELLTESATNILSTTTSPAESDTLTQTDKEVTLHERSSSISTIDTARLIQAFGHERVCLSPRRIKLYSSITDHQRRYLEKRSRKNKKVLNTGHPLMTSEHTRRKHLQVANHMISSDSISSSTSSFWSSSSTLCNKQHVHMLNKGIQAGNLEIVNGVRKHTRDVGMTFPTPSSSEAREEDSDVTSWSEGKVEEKRLLTNYLGDKRLWKNKQSCREGVTWFVPVENVKSGPKKENLPKLRGPGVSWFAPITSTKPWREPLREQNWQRQHMASHGSPAGPGRDPLRPFVRATLQESLQLHRPDFISRSRERIKRLKLIVQERKLQNMLQSEREALFNAVREWQGYRDPMRPLPKRGFLAAEKNRPIGKKEMIQRSKRIYEQLPEVQKKREEEKRRSEYKSYRLRAQLYKKKVTNQLLGRKVPWD